MNKPNTSSQSAAAETIPFALLPIANSYGKPVPGTVRNVENLNHVERVFLRQALTKVARLQEVQ